MAGETVVYLKMTDLILPAIICGVTIAFLFMVLFIGLDGLQGRLERGRKSKRERDEYEPRRSSRQSRQVRQESVDRGTDREELESDHYEPLPPTRPRPREQSALVEQRQVAERPYEPGRRQAKRSVPRDEVRGDEDA